MVLIQVCLVVILYGGQFYIVIVQFVGQGYDIVDLFDVLCGQVEVQYYGVFVLFYQFCYFQFLFERVMFIVNQVVSIGIGGLEVQLNMVEISFMQCGNMFFGQVNV